MSDVTIEQQQSSSQQQQQQADSSKSSNIITYPPHVQVPVIDDFITLADVSPNSTAQAVESSATPQSQSPASRELHFAVYTRTAVTSSKAHRIILYFHGTPGDRHYMTPSQINEINNTYNNDSNGGHNVTCICVERPGFGNSTVHKNRTLLSYARDIEHFVQHKKITTELKLIPTFDDSDTTELYIIGYSGGGPFALACGYYFSQQLKDQKQPNKSAVVASRIKRIACVNSLAPRHYPTSTLDMPWLLRFAFWISSMSPWLSEKLIRLDNAGFLEDPEKVLKHMFEFNPCDVEALVKQDPPEMKEMFKYTIRQVYSKNQYANEAWEYYLFANDWGFDLKNIAIPVLVYHGAKDKSCVKAMGQILKQSTFFYSLLLIYKKSY